MSLRTLLPTITNRSGGDAEAAQDLVVGGGVLLEDDLDVLEVVVETARLHLVGLVDQVALGDEQQPVVRAHGGEHLRARAAADAPAPRAGVRVISTSSADHRGRAPQPSVMVIAASTIEIANDFTP